MKLSKRETILVCILFGILLIAGAYLLLFQPLQTRYEASKQQMAQLDVEKTEMELRLTQPDPTENYQEQLEQAEKNYDSFYATLNSYTIDNILSALMDEQELRIISMDISPYLPIERPIPTVAEASKAAEQEETPSVNAANLLKCSVKLEGGGDFERVMKLVDAMNDKSFCVSVHDMQVTYATERNQVKEQTQFSCTVEIYGIDTPDGIALA